MCRFRLRSRNTRPTPMRLAVLRLLEAIRILGLEKKTRFYQASTSELYGLVQETPQNGDHALLSALARTASPSLYGYWIVVNYREAYGMYACNGILFNHESPMRGETFVTRKITRGLARIKVGLQAELLSRQSRRQARLGPCPRLHRDAVADAAAGETAGLRHRHRTAVQRTRVCRALRRSARTRSRLAGFGR